MNENKNRHTVWLTDETWSKVKELCPPALAIDTAYWYVMQLERRAER